tara:strand:+ start:38 stop:301 length:264 start_codon:yes stop_codon:yes gene_type:complete
MKFFLYKTITIIIAVILVFKLTVGQLVKNYEDKISSLTDKKSREEIIEKIKDEIRSANNKENILDAEERKILSTFIKKLKSELESPN